MPQAAIEIPPLSLIERYGVTGPRFTSYPTALSFRDSVGDDDFREALARSNDQLIPSPLALYLHIPFCRALCYYCACHKKVTRNAAVVSSYLTALHREIAAKARLIDADRCVRQLHIGGGTPTYLNAGQREALMQVINHHFRIEQGDVSIEIDPRTLAPDAMAGLAALGFNRISVGIQDVDREVQRAVNRVHDIGQVAELIAAAREAGIESVSVDLIYGLPHQTTTSFAATVDAVIGLAPDALSVFSYAHLPGRFAAQRLIRSDDLPDAMQRIRIFRDCVVRLGDAGYDYIGMDHFALPDSYLGRARRDGTLHRCFQGYASGAGSETLGLGASAISHIGDGYFQAEKPLNRYTDAIAAGGCAIARGYLCDDDDRRVADVIQSLMCYGYCDIADWEARYRREFGAYFASELAALAPMVTDGLAVVDARGVRVTPLGVVFLRSIAGCFDRSAIDRRQCSANV